MANMREIKERIESISEIMKITNAMYLISSSKLKRARRQLDATAPYFENIQFTIHHILKHADYFEHPFFDNGRNKPEDKKNYGYIVVTGDKGMCGSYNHNILKLAEKEIEKRKNVTLFVVGSVGRSYFDKKGMNVDTEFLYTAQNPALYQARRIQETVTELFLQGKLDEVYVVYTELRRSAETPVVMKLFPFDRERFEKTEAPDGRHHSIAEFEPSPEAVMDHLVPNFAKGLVFGILAEAFCSEQNARMRAMDNATNSAGEIIAQLKLDYNRARQAAITQEITEVASGARSQRRKDG